MKRPAHLLSMLGLALICAGAVPLAAAQATPVLAQELKSVRASGKVLTALWTVRSDSSTLQLVFPRIPALQPVRLPAAPRTAQVQVWLLNADGTQIAPTRRWETPAAQKTCLRCISYEVLYSFPLSASREAVAAAVRIDDDYYIEPLQPLANDKG